MCDKLDAEVLGLLKIDALGLTQLSVIEDTLEMAGLKHSTISLSVATFDDQKALHILNARRFAGIFQFNGPALQNLCMKTTIWSFEDMVALTALARPGPLDSGEAARWIAIRTGKAKPTYPHPLFEPILKATLGIVIYQEQVMQICRAVGMSWEEVSTIRRLISKSAGPEALEQYHDSFRQKATSRDMSEDVADDVWNVLKASGAYSFNKSHAVAYSIISYWCCWLKAHHPLEFAAATLTHAGDDMQLRMLRELSKEGTRYVAADKDKSIDKWTVATVGDRRTLIGPLRNIVGIGPKHEAAILSVRARPRERLPDSVGKILHRMKTKLDDLWPIKTAIDGMMTDALKQDLVSKRWEITDVQPNGQAFNVMVIGKVDSLTKIDENTPDRVQRRNGRLAGGQYALNLWISDDTDKIFAKIHWSLFSELGEEMLGHGKGYYAIRGTVPPDFRMINVDKFRFIGADHAENQPAH
jgi:DNA polymerase III alpha subunit